MPRMDRAPKGSWSKERNEKDLWTSRTNFFPSPYFQGILFAAVTITGKGKEFGLVVRRAMFGSSQRASTVPFLDIPN